MAVLQLKFNENINATKICFLLLMMDHSPVPVCFFLLLLLFCFYERLYPKINNTAHNKMYFSLRHPYCITLSSPVSILDVLGFASELLLKYITCLLWKNYIDYYQLFIYLFLMCLHRIWNLSSPNKD